MAEPQAPSPLDDAVERLTRQTGGGALDVPRRADALDDAMAMAAQAAGGVARGAHPDVERGLAPIDAAVAASGLLAWRTGRGRRWWTALTNPLVVATARGHSAVIPGGRHGLMVDGTTRHARPIDKHTAAEVGADRIAIAQELPPDTRWWRLISWSLRRRGDVWLMLGLGAVGGLAGLVLPVSTAAIFESAVPSGDGARVAGILLAFAVCTVALAVLTLTRGLLVVRLRDRSDMVLAPALFARLLRLRASFFRSRSDGDVLNRALSVDAARAQVDDGVVAALITAVFGMVNLGFLIVTDVGVGLVAAAATLVALTVSLTAQLRARGLLAPLLEARSRSDATLMSLLGGLVVWRVGGAEDRALARWAVDQGESTVALDRRLRAVSITGPVDVGAPLFVLVAFVVAVILLPGERLQPGSASAPGVFLSLYASVAQLALAMTALGGQLVVLTELGPILGRAHPIALEPVERTQDSRSPGPLGGAMALSQVVFGYRRDQPPLLDGVSLSIAAGEFVAVVGPSGGGKSTVMRLLLGFDEPWAGSVSYDGRDLAGLDPSAVRRQLGVVLQTTRPLGVSVRDCVTGQRQLDDAEVWDLLERAGLADDVRRMDGRLEATVGDHGLLLSGGQRQRLMIAGALAGRPRILLLDEATSALDNVTQTVVMRTILSSAATRLVVAHRMTTVRNADRVVVVAGGRIAEEGTPAELLASGGHFARLAKRQEV